MDTVCTTAIKLWADKETPDEMLDEHLCHFNALHTSLQRLENDILLHDGMSAEWSEVVKGKKLVSQMVRWLEEIVILVMGDPGLVKFAYQKRDLSFQEGN